LPAAQESFLREGHRGPGNPWIFFHGGSGVMNKRRIFAGFGLLVLLGAGLLAQVQAQSMNALLQLVMVGLPQTQVVRDSADRSRYYLCWTDGLNHYGFKFSRRSFDDKLAQLRPGAHAALGSLLTLDPGGWTAADDKTCQVH
jgi:hypothetical protein